MNCLCHLVQISILLDSLSTKKSKISTYDLMLINICFQECSRNWSGNFLPAGINVDGIHFSQMQREAIFGPIVNRWLQFAEENNTRVGNTVIVR